MQWLYAHFPSLQLDHFVLEQAEDKQAALVVFCPQHNEILQVSQCASTAGIKRGMGLAQACALLNRIQLIPYSAEVECQQLHLLANQLYRIASDIVLLEPQGIAIKLDPIIHYYHSVDNFVALFHHVLQSTALLYHFASGPSVEAAQVLALAGADTVYLSNAQALIALQNVSLKYTQFTSKQVSQFDRMGIRTLQAVFQIPLEEVGKRFDNALISYLLALKGNKAVPRATFHPKQHFRYQCELPYELEDSVKLLRFLTQPVEQCCEYLVSQNLTTDSLQLTLHLADSPKQHVEVRAGAPMHNAKDWLSLITLKLEQLALTSAIRGFQLRCEHTVVFHATSEHLFAVRFNQHAENMLMGTLLAKLGSDAVITPRVCHDHRQDLHIRHGLPHSGAACEQLPSGQHPCWLLIDPQPLSTQTKIVYGPERIQTGWWDDSAVKRDYFIALSSTGQRLWIFRDHQSNWFVHGYFS